MSAIWVLVFIVGVVLLIILIRGFWTADFLSHRSSVDTDLWFISHARGTIVTGVVRKQKLAPGLGAGISHSVRPTAEVADNTGTWPIKSWPCWPTHPGIIKVSVGGMLLLRPAPDSVRLDFAGFTVRDHFGWKLPDGTAELLAREVVIPSWAAFALAGLLILAPLPWRRFIAHLRRPRPGFCPVCGYDLRATPERCPECGTVTGTQKLATMSPAVPHSPQVWS